MCALFSLNQISLCKLNVLAIFDFYILLSDLDRNSPHFYSDFNFHSEFHSFSNFVFAMDCKTGFLWKKTKQENFFKRTEEKN